MKRAFLTSAIAALVAVPAFAGSLVVPEPEVVYAPPAAESVWDGAYVDVYYAFQMNSVIGALGSARLAGIQAGYNFANDPLIYGIEVDYSRVIPGGPALASIGGRVGIEPSDNALLFGILGYGAVTGGGTQYVLAGAGAQFSLNGSLFVRGEVDHLAPTGGGVGVTLAKFGIGMNF